MISQRLSINREGRAPETRGACASAPPASLPWETGPWELIDALRDTIEAQEQHISDLRLLVALFEPKSQPATCDMETTITQEITAGFDSSAPTNAEQPKVGDCVRCGRQGAAARPCRRQRPHAPLPSLRLHQPGAGAAGMIEENAVKEIADRVRNFLPDLARMEAGRMILERRVPRVI